jgi:hypothetical protein
MSKFSNLFRQVGSARPPATYTDRLEAGEHKLVLERFEPKVITKKNNTQAVIVEADFTILESTTHKTGETRGWSWFPGDEFGYQDGRVRAFVETAGACVGDATEAAELCEQLSEPSQPGRGIEMMCKVVTVINKDGSARLSSKGEAITNANFYMIQQTLEQVANNRKELDNMKPLKLASTQPAPTPTPTPAPPPAAKPVGMSLLGSLGKR